MGRKKDPALVPDDMMTVDEFAAFIRKSKEYVYKLNHQGRGPKRYKVGGGKMSPVLYKRSEVLEWLDSHLVLDATGLLDCGDQ